MKFLVTCLLEGGLSRSLKEGTRVLASRSKSFDSLPKAIMYGGSIAEDRKAMTVPVIDGQTAGEVLYNRLVETRPRDLDVDIFDEIRTESHNDGYIVFFADDDHAVAIHTGSVKPCHDEFERMRKEGQK